ncbi:MAG: class I SAM-dependent methyltransferase [Candidatus Eiseniibacteriota bacterium]
MVEAQAGRACLLCGGEAHDVVFREFGVDVLRCRRCAHVFSAHDGASDYEGYWGDRVVDAGEFYWDRAHGAIWQDFFARFVAGRPPGRLLDVGCGLGYFVRAMQRSFPEWETEGWEISPAAVRHAREVLAVRNVHQGRIEPGTLPEGRFDVVTLWDVLEHLREPDPLLRALRAALKPDGRLYLHTPNVDVQVPKAKIKRLLRGMKAGVHYLEARDHLHLYSPRTVRMLLERCGFADVSVFHQRPIQSVSGSRSALLRAAKNAGFAGARVLDGVTGGRLNLDNLHVTARRPATVPVAQAGVPRTPGSPA